jgi:hypothetical protein
VSDPLYNKLAFNGFVVLWWNHNTRTLETNRLTQDSLVARGFDGIPSIKELVQDLYEVYGDVVGKVSSFDNVVLYDNMVEMLAIEKEMSIY